MGLGRTVLGRGALGSLPLGLCRLRARDDLGRLACRALRDDPPNVALAQELIAELHKVRLLVSIWGPLGYALCRLMPCLPH